MNERYEQLKTKLNELANAYYNEDKSLTSDYEYDVMMRELRNLESTFPELITNDSPTQNVNNYAGSKDRDVVHNIPMLSIADVFTKEDVLDWVHHVRGIHPDVVFCIEHKIDGLSLTLRYRNGNLFLAETRGNGFIGEDVTDRALQIEDVHNDLHCSNEYLELRGEVYMTRSQFNQYNNVQESLGKKIAANARNLAAGTMRQLDSSIVKNRGLSMFVFNVQDGPRNLMFKHSIALKHLSTYEKITTVPSFRCVTDEDILKKIDEIGNSRDVLPYDIDGAVIKIDQVAYRDDFTGAAKYSPGMVAYKYPPEEKETVLRDVIISVGRSGRINPTAIFDPIYLCGTTVSRATLNNQDFIDKKNIGIGDTIRIFKSGEIIPTVKNVNKEKRPDTWTRYIFPECCPICGSVISKRIHTNGTEGLSYCLNPICPAKQVRAITHFGCRDAMNIEGISEKKVQKLIDLGIIKSYEDFYYMKSSPLLKTLTNEEGWGTLSIKNLLSAIEKSKNTTFERVLYAIGIPHVGRDQSKLIGKKCNQSMKQFMDMVNRGFDFTSIDGIGPVINESIHNWFALKNEISLECLMKMFALFNFKIPDSPKSNQLSEKVFVITGSVEHFKNRNELKSYIEANGGTVSGSISKKTNYLINNDVGSTSGKNQKALELQIPIISEESFLALSQKA